MSTKKKRETVIPIAWLTCPHCGARYDNGNAFAAFPHRNRECVAAILTPEEAR